MAFFQQFLITTWDLLCNYSLLDIAKDQRTYATQSERVLKNENSTFATKGRYHRHERRHGGGSYKAFANDCLKR